MEHAISTRIAQALNSAPVVARLGLAAPDARCRERAAETLAAIVADTLAGPEPIYDDRQMAFPAM